MNLHDQTSEANVHIVFDRRRILRITVPLIAGLATAPSVRRSTFGRSPTAGDATVEAGATPQCASPIVPASPVAVWTIVMTNQLRFDPEVLRIRRGDTVEWINDSAMPHTATCDPAKNPVAASHPEYVVLPDGAEPWSSELLQPGERYRHTFDRSGEYRYFCIPHVLSGMRASIVVDC